MSRTPIFPSRIAVLALALGLAACGSGGDLAGAPLDAAPTASNPSVPFVPAPPPALWADDACTLCHGANGGGAAAGPNVQCTDYDRLDAHVRTAPTSHAGGAFPALTDQDLLDLVAFLQTADCPGAIPGDPTSPPPSSEVPASHTESEHGVLHHPDYESNLATCTACHGASLEGTSFAPACAMCHGGGGFDDDDELEGDDEDEADESDDDEEDAGGVDDDDDESDEEEADESDDGEEDEGDED